MNAHLITFGQKINMLTTLARANAVPAILVCEGGVKIARVLVKGQRVKKSEFDACNEHDIIIVNNRAGDRQR